MKIETEIIQDEIEKGEGIALDQDPGQVRCFLEDKNGEVYVNPNGLGEWIKAVKGQIIDELKNHRELVNIYSADYLNQNGKAYKIEFQEGN